MTASHSSCNDFKMAGMEVADGGFGFTNGEALSSIRSSAAKGSCLIGSTPLSCKYFSMSRLSKICPETGETTGFSGL